MAQFQRSFSIAANATLDNALTGSQWEFIQSPAAEVIFGLVASATGLRVDVYSGADTLAEDLEPSIINRFPIWPDDYNLPDVALQGDRLKVRARNTTAGALTLFVGVRINEQG